MGKGSLHITTVLLFVLFPLAAWSQQAPVENQTLANLVRRADSLCAAAHYDVSNTLYKKTVSLAEEKKNWPYQIEGLYKLSLNKSKQGDLKKASTYLAQALRLSQQHEAGQNIFRTKYCHQQGIIAEARADYKAALEWYQTGLQRAKAENQTVWIVRMKTGLGEIHTNQGDYPRAMQELSEAEDLYFRNHLLDKKLLRRIYNSYGIVYQQKGEYASALDYYRKSYELDRERLRQNHPDLGRSLNNLAIIYYYQSDYQRALDHMKKAVGVLADFYGENHRLVAAGYNNIGIVYSEIGELTRARDYLEKALHIKKKVLGKDHPDIAIAYQNLGAIHFDLKEYDRAISYYKRAEKTHLKNFSEGHPELANVYANLGQAYAKKEAYEKALDYYQKDLDINLKLLDGQHPFIGDTYTKIGETYAMDENYEKALQYYRRAIAVFVKNYNRENSLQNIVLRNVIYPAQLLTTLRLYGRALQQYADQIGRQQPLQWALQTYLTATQLIDKLQRSYNREGSKFLLRKRTHDLYMRGTETAYKLLQQTGDARYKEYAFYFAEKSKSQILLEQLQDMNARSFANIPDSLIRRETNLRKHLTGLQQQLSLRVNNPQKEDSLKRIALQDSLFQLRVALNDHIKQLEDAYPKYHELKYKPVVTTATEVQQNILEPHQTLVAYSMGKEDLFAFIISRHHFEIRKMAADSLFRKEIIDFRKLMLETTSPRKFSERSHELYQRLFGPIADLIDKKLLIIPDGVLNLLPFESLVSRPVPETETARFHKLSYLVHDYTISYAPSAGYLTLNKQTTVDAKKEFLGFAPVFSDIRASEKRIPHAEFNRPLSSLPSSKQEVQQLDEIFSEEKSFWSFLPFVKSHQRRTDIYLKKNATEQAFKNLSLEDYRFIHLATHAFVSEEKPEQSGILFASSNDNAEDGILHASEIYNLQLDARLVTLSACKTGVGTLAKGEGMMSLSRAFQYAGAQNLLVSLWNVDDRSTAQLMVDFYAQLGHEKNMPTALRKAKLNMIRNGRYAHPQNWAPFIFIGK